MKESVLKKQFTQRDVQRMRNLISGKSGEKTRVQAGYEKQTTAHIEGDVWEENGKTWTIKNGVKQNITKFDQIKKLVVLPLTCPCCNKPMKITEANKKMYSVHNRCLDCVIELEHTLRKEGKYGEYQQSILNANKNSMVDDLEKALDAWVNDKDTFVTEQGDIEDWAETSKEKDYQQAKEVLQKIRDAEL